MSLSVNYPSSPRNLIACAVDWLQQGDQIALLTLINIEGSAPYPIGSQMLVNLSGEYRGQITGGCAEIALAEQAVAAIKLNKNITHRYGLDSVFFDIQLPCGSGMDVYFDVTTRLPELVRLDDELKARRRVQKTLDTSLGLVAKIYRPNERLILFGQGPILVSLAQLAVLSGFEVICLVQNASSISQLEGLGIKASKLRNDLTAFMDYCDQFTALVSLFHEHALETDILTAALATQLFYVGALGSRRTHMARLESLRENNLEAAALDRIFAPVGVDIKAETPAQIAISVLAQIVEKMSKQNES